MFLHVVEAKYIGGYKVWLRFNDGASGEVDLSEELDGAVFETLKDTDFFKKFSLRHHTISWDTGADFAPEFLHEKLVQPALAMDAHHVQVVGG